VKTPNIDRLAAKGVRFDRAYCQFPLCNPSRTSFLSGRRPDMTQIMDNNTRPRTTLKDVVFLPQYFKQQGYFTGRADKIFHISQGNTVNMDDPACWDLTEEVAATHYPENQVFADRITRR